MKTLHEHNAEIIQQTEMITFFQWDSYLGKIENPVKRQEERERIHKLIVIIDPDSQTIRMKKGWRS